MSIFSSWRVEHGHLVRERTQPGRVKILNANAELRKNPEAQRDLSFMGDRLCIPELDYYRLTQAFPELKSVDAEIKTKAWRKFYSSGLADPYRVKNRNLARG